jgi:hypothetical protein
MIMKKMAFLCETSNKWFNFIKEFANTLNAFTINGPHKNFEVSEKGNKQKSEK